MNSIERIFLPREGSLGFGNELENADKSFKKEFLGRDFNKENLISQAQQKTTAFSQKSRDLLYKVWSEQYRNLDFQEKVQMNIEAIKSNKTVTVTTGHQLSLATGPLYFIYKIIHVINLCESMNHETENFRYVPVFWMASEDHDFQEIQSLHFFSKTVSWSSKENGAVGRFSTLGLNEVYDEIVSFFNEDAQKEIQDLLKLNPDDSYGTHFLKLIHRLFGVYGLLVIDGDQTPLKKCMIPVFNRELSENVLEKEVHQTNEKLFDWNRKPQAFVRPINLFYLQNGQRIRIEKEANSYKVNNEHFSFEEMADELEQYPDRFSPNALLRPIYQEFILPNVCYVGGSGELAYWTQLKSSFQKFGIEFPMLRTRCSAFFIKKQWVKDQDLASLFLPLKAQYEMVSNGDELQKRMLNEIQEKWEDFESKLRESTRDFGKGAQSWTESELTKMQGNLSSFTSKWMKQNKQRFEGVFQRKEKIHKHLYPSGIPQERFQNILHLCPKGNWMDRLSFLKSSIDPFELDLHIFIENDETK